MKLHCHVRRLVPLAAAAMLCLSCSEANSGSAGDDGTKAYVSPDAGRDAASSAVPSSEVGYGTDAPAESSWETHNLGAFRLELRTDEGRVMEWVVKHEDLADTELLRASIARLAIEASSGAETVTERGGSFLISDATSWSCKDLTLDEVEESGGTLTLSGAFADCSAVADLIFRPLSNARLAMTLRVEGESDADDGTYVNRTTLRWASDASERFHGLGEQFSATNMKGRLLPIWVQEQGIGRGLEPVTGYLNGLSPGTAGDWFTTYSHVPAFITNRGRAMVFENQEYMEIDLREDDRAGITAFSNELRGQIVAADTPLAQVTALTELTGRMEPLPEWTQKGAIVRSWGGSAEARRRVAELRSVGAVVVGLWIEDWAGARVTPFGTRMWWNWEVDADLYPDWPELVSELANEGVRVLIYLNPFLADATSKENKKRNLFAEAKEAGLLVKTDGGELFTVDQGGFDAGLLDLTKPEAVVFIRSVMDAQLALGVSGWMADFGEALPYDAVLASGEDPRKWHNEYPRAWARVSREAAEAAGKWADVLFFSRSGDLKSPGTTRAFWVGDQMVSWDGFDGLQTVVPAMTSSGLVGWSLQHSDTGGFTSVSLGPVQHLRTPELFSRWAELNAYTPLLRTHSTNLPDKNPQYDVDAATLAHFAARTVDFASLANYRLELMDEAEKHGWPLVRHLLLHYPEHQEAWEADQQFMLGDRFLVAPVVTEGAEERTLWLPPGKWTHEPMGKIYEGPATITVEAPLGSVPAFRLAP
jgi:sulfoquinovosidase